MKSGHEFPRAKVPQPPRSALLTNQILFIKGTHDMRVELCFYSCGVCALALPKRYYSCQREQSLLRKSEIFYWGFIFIFVTAFYTF